MVNFSIGMAPACPGEREPYPWHRHTHSTFQQPDFAASRWDAQAKFERLGFYSPKPIALAPRSRRYPWHDWQNVKLVVTNPHSAQTETMALTPSAAYLLVTHGSRDPRPEQGVKALAARLPAWLTAASATPAASWSQPRAATAVLSPPVIVGTAALELAPQPLHVQITEFAETAIAAGIRTIQLLPLFLLPGVHVKEDIPAEVATAQAHLGDRATIRCTSHLGASPQLPQLLQQQLQQQFQQQFQQQRQDPHGATIEDWLLLAHGSRRSGGNAPIEALADDLDLTAVYWAVEPTLEQGLEPLLKAGKSRLGIIPYLLFQG